MAHEDTSRPSFGFFFEVIFALVIFESFHQWPNVVSWQGKILLIFLYILIVNDWLASRSGSALASIALSLFTLLDLFIFISLVLGVRSFFLK